ncbi:thioredoxin reductase [Candidatus Woesearchaeota archaeon]|nr:MAG: thioredoxin reductase [Candidatus Woesearchaeota archaeon]
MKKVIRMTDFVLDGSLSAGESKSTEETGADEKKTYDLIIIGGGVVGGAALMYAGRLGMKVLMIGETLGGTIILTDTVENYPGFKKLTGKELADRILEHAKEYPVEIEEDRVKSVRKLESGCFEVKTFQKTFKAKSILFATGTKHRKLNVPGSEEFENRGVHYCALCDGYFYKDKVVAVVGGGDSAAKEALILAEHASKVYIIARGDHLKAEPINRKRVEENPKIEVILKTNVTEIFGDKTVTGVKLDNPYNGKDILELSAVFVEIGQIPQTELAKELGVELNAKGEIIIDRDSKTNMEGVFAAGDCVNSSFKQAIVGVGEAVVAVYSAYNYVGSREISCD